MIRYINTNRKEDCCGCRACEQICKHNAISLEIDEEGFLYPILDNSACVNCGLCEKVCPMEQAEHILYKEGKIFAAQNKNKKDLFTSSSGGVFSAIAKSIILDKGVVYGAAFENGPSLCHKRVTTVDGLEMLKGSKYLQSDIKKTFVSVRQDLKAGLKVYFVGTPCQVAGLRLFLRNDYESLFTSDFVCHGTPSNKVFCNTISQIEKKIGGYFKNYSFRDKRVKGWNCSSSSSWDIGGKEKNIIYSKDMEAYFNAFISGDMMRMNCYKCPFARHERCSDITLADYWGVRVYDPDFPSIGKGVSMILLNTEKGELLFNSMRAGFNTREIPISHTVRNKNFHTPSTLTANRNDSYKLAFNDYDAFIERYYTKNYFISYVKVFLEFRLRKSHFLLSIVSLIKRMMK